MTLTVCETLPLEQFSLRKFFFSTIFNVSNKIIVLGRPCSFSVRLGIIILLKN